MEKVFKVFGLITVILCLFLIVAIITFGLTHGINAKAPRWIFYVLCADMYGWIALIVAYVVIRFKVVKEWINEFIN